MRGAVSRVAFVALVVLVAGCASSHVMIGQRRPAISPDQVKLYVRPPADYEEIAILQASDRGAFAFTDQGRTNKVIERLKKEAAELGANGILISGLNDQYAGAVTSSSATAVGNTASGYGVTSAVMQKQGSGLAIYVKTE